MSASRWIRRRPRPDQPVAGTFASRMEKGNGYQKTVSWRERNREVDFIVKTGRKLTAIEVKSGRATGTFPGITAFVKTFKPSRTLLVGGDGVPLDEFLTRPVEHWVE